MPLPFLAVDVLAIAQAVIPFLLILLLVVIVHEAGHFFAAKLCGIKVLEFGIGFPPRVKALTWRKGETEYTINWLPIGGFVRLLGEEDPSDPRSLAAASRPKRLFVMSAGILMNIVLAVVLFGVGFMIPRERDLSMAQVAAVAEGSPAAEAQVTGEMRDGSEPLQGLQPGDIVMEIEGREVRNLAELRFATRLNLGETQDWTIVRQGSTLQAEVFARWHPPADQGPTGIQISTPASCVAFDAAGECTDAVPLYPFSESQWYWPWEAIPKGAQSVVDTVVLTYNEIRVRVGGGGGGGVSNSEPAFTGPVGIADTTGRIIDEAGWRSLIELAALLSLNLGLFNALPIPMLDGGRILFVLIEIVRGGRRIAPEKEALVHLTGFALMIASVVIITFFDVRRLIT